MKRRLRRRLIRKITAAVSLLFVFGVIYYFITGFFGNPVDTVIAGYKIKNYVHEKYPDNDFEISGAKYNFKTGSYMSLIQSKTIKDMRFYVSCRKGKISDSYEYDVDGRYMTYWRLASEFNDRVEEIIKSGFKEKTDIVIGDFIKKDDDYSMLSLDMPLDITNPPFDTQLTVYILSVKISYDVLCARLQELSKLMLDNKVPIDLYSVVIEEATPDGEKAAIGVKALHLYEFPAEKLQSEDLTAAIKEHISEYEARYAR